MTELELREKLVNLKDELETIINTGESEKRELVEDETNRMAEIRSEIENVEAEISRLEDENRKIAKQNNNKSKENRKMENVKLFNLVKEVVNGNVSDEHRAFIQGNNINYRAAIQATATGMGEEVVPEEKTALELQIRNNTVLDKLGVSWMSNCVGNVSIPKYAGSNAYFADSENANAPDGASAFTEVLLQPRRITSELIISRQFLAQSEGDAEALLIADLARSIAERIDLQLFSADSGSTSRFAGLFADAETGTLASMTFDDVLALENSVEEKNGTNFVFVTTPNVKYHLRGTQTASGLQMVFDGGEIDGRQTVVSNSVVKGGLMVVDPRDIQVCTWDNDMVITVDAITLAHKNQIRIVCNYLVDAALKGDRIATEIFS